MKKILLINPRKGWRPALGLLYVASYLRNDGYEVKIIEFIDEVFFPDSNRKLWQELYDYDPDVIGLGIISWNRIVAMNIIKKIRTTTQNKIIICGGKDPTYKPINYLECGADFVIMNEGEETMVELLNALNSRGSTEEIQGISLIKEGKLIINGGRSPINLDNLLFPAFELIDYSHYCNIRLGGIPGHFIKTGFIMANRGCPYRCRFCTDPVRNIYRERPLDNIIDEIKWQVKNWKIDGLVFLDDLFFHSEKRVIDFCNRIISENINLKLYAQTRVNKVGSAYTLSLMRKAGFIQLALGVESGSQRLLNIMNKGTNLEQTRQSIKKINDAGIFTYAFLILGFSEETREDLQLTAKFIEKIKPTFIAVNYFMPMPGTEYFSEEDELAIEKLSFSLTENQQEFRSPVPREEIISYRNKFLSLAQRSADRNLLRYPSFYAWIARLAFLQPGIILRGLYLQKKNKTYTSYMDAVRTAMINNRIYNN